MNPENKKKISVSAGARATSCILLQFSSSHSSWYFCVGYRANYLAPVPSLGICKRHSRERLKQRMARWRLLAGNGLAFEGCDKGAQKCTLK